MAPGDHYDIGTGESRARLTHAPGGKHVPAAEGIRRVDKNDVHIAREGESMKAVVEHKPFHPAPCELLTTLKTIRAHTERHTVAQPRFKQLHFVAGRVVAQGPGLPRPDFLATVAARQDANTLALSYQPVGNPEHHGRLPRAADRQIANTDHPSAQPPLFQNSLPIRARAQMRHRAIRHGKRPQKRILPPRHADFPSAPRMRAMRLRETAVAPRFRSLNWRAALPMRSRSASSSINCTHTFPSCWLLLT